MKRQIGQQEKTGERTEKSEQAKEKRGEFDIKHRLRQEERRKKNKGNKLRKSTRKYLREESDVLVLEVQVDLENR